MRGINEIMSALRNIPTSGGVSSMGALGDIAQRISSSMPRGSENPQPFGNLLEHSDEKGGEAPVDLPVSKEKPVDRSVGAVAMLGMRTAIARPGVAASKWQNPFVSAAIPPLLLLHRLEDQSFNFDTSLRGQLGLELRMFREKLASSGEASQWIDDASYLLCTHIDELLNEACRKQELPMPEKSLLVEFHGDAWGGEDCFIKLEAAMNQERPPIALLELYEIILGLGFQGRYQVIDRGDVLLQDLRGKLHRMIWDRAPDGLALRSGLPKVFKQRWLTPFRFFLIGAALLFMAYLAGVFDTAMRGSPLREALAAYEPPVREINISETLPPPLPELIAEGWLTAERRDDGWLLIFRADGAFESGRAEIKPEFLPNLTRLGAAFAPWPGDLEVIGHSDLTPIFASRFPSNQALSEARAREVAKLLKQQVVGGKVERQVTASGMGEKAPVVAEISPAANLRNRRVEVLWKVAATRRVVTEIIR
jgi:type VI secretion system protein ImpK